MVTSKGYSASTAADPPAAVSKKPLEE